MWGDMKLISFAAACLLSSTYVVAAPSKAEDKHWVATWTSMPQLVEQANLPPAPFTLSSVFRNATLRQTLHTSIGAKRIRIQISNLFGGSTLPITAATFALPIGGEVGVGSIDTTTIQELTFNGASSVDIPQGETVYTDPIDVEIGPRSMLTVSLYSEAGQCGTNITGHPGSRTSTWMQSGNQVNALNVTTANTAHWYFLSAIEAWAPMSTKAFVILGDSISDGRGSTDNQNDRWPDLVLAKMQENGIKHIAVVNQAAGGNAVIPASHGNGPALMDRYKRDLIGTAGAAYGIIFEGVNDIGVAPTDRRTQKNLVQQLKSDFRTMCSAAKAAGIKMFGATITPFGGEGQAYSVPSRDNAREKLNRWIMNGGHNSYAASIDFASFVANPANASELYPPFDSGDHLHPNAAGYQAIADNFPLDIFD
ncbi:SGNH hydrolase-type esterase domain-containing protein [Xylaria nigripes]|nr:SGNH hydrolase-type esterase domain-containing protein [Xylaria nigripes]